jgi:hypothetical protein
MAAHELQVASLGTLSQLSAIGYQLSAIQPGRRLQDGDVKGVAERVMRDHYRGSWLADSENLRLTAHYSPA